MKKKFFLLIAVLSILFLSGCEQNIKTPKFKLTLIQPENGKIEVTPALPSDGMVEKGREFTFTLSANEGYQVKTLTINGTAYSDITDNSITKKIKIEKNTAVSGAVEEDTENPPAPLKKYKVTITQPANGKIEVTPALPSDGMIEKGSELTFTLSANTGYKVKTLTIDGTAYSDITDNRITQTVKIEKDTAVSGAAEEDTENPPAPLTKYKVTITQPANGKIEVTPALPSDGMIEKGSELTFTLSANSGYKVKTLTIDGTAYSDITDKRITQKVKIEKNTEVSGAAEAISTPPSPEPQEELDSESVFKLEENGEEFKLTGSICIDDIKSAKFIEYLKKAEGKNIDTSTFKINCFKTIKSSTGRNVATTSTTEPIPVKVTPELLNNILEIGQNFSNFELNNKLGNKIVEVALESATNNYFDITKFAKFDFNSEFKLKNGSVIYLNGIKAPNQLPAGWDLTEYSTAEEMAKIASNDSLRKYLKVDKVKLRGNVKSLLPYLVDGDKKITEINGGIEFNNRYKADCKGISKTGYYGNEGGEVLDVKQLQELHRRVKNEGVTIYNAIIKNLDSKTAQSLENLHFNKDILVNIIFDKSDLANIEITNVTAGLGYIKFVNTTLPKNMHGTDIGELILKNVTFPKFTGTFEDLPYAVPEITSLTIYEKIENSPLKNLTNAQLNTLKNSEKPKKMPKKYTGPKEVYNKLKEYIFNGESQIKDFGNYQGSIQKIKDQYLALIQNQGRSRG